MTQGERLLGAARKAPEAMDGTVASGRRSQASRCRGRQLPQRTDEPHAKCISQMVKEEPQSGDEELIAELAAVQLPADVAVLKQPQGAMQGADKRVTVKETDKELGGGQCRSGLNRFAALSADSDEELTTVPMKDDGEACANRAKADDSRSDLRTIDHMLASFGSGSGAGHATIAMRAWAADALAKLEAAGF
jgi:hypothetical protein